MKVIENLEQGTKAWLDARRCKVTGTKLDLVMGSTNDQMSLIAELIAEEGTEQSKVLRPTPEMERGTAEEVFAVKRYESVTKQKVTKVGMLVSDEFDWLAISPDGVIKKNGKFTKHIEVKNPDSKTLILYKMYNLVDGLQIAPAKRPFLGIPQDYKWQAVAGFIVNEDCMELDFLVHDARFIDDEAKLYIITISRDDPALQEAIAEAKDRLIAFRKEWLRIKEIVLPTNF